MDITRSHVRRRTGGSILRNSTSAASARRKSCALGYSGPNHPPQGRERDLANPRIENSSKNLLFVRSGLFAAVFALVLSGCSTGGGGTTTPLGFVSGQIRAASGADKIRGGFAPFPISIGNEASPFTSVAQTITGRPRYAVSVPWEDGQGDLNFSISLLSGLTEEELAPVDLEGRFIDTSISEDVTFDEVMNQGFGGDWRAFKARKKYPGVGTLTVNVVTDANDTNMLRKPWVDYGAFERHIELRDIPALPAGYDWHLIYIEDESTGAMHLAGSLDGVPGRFTCPNSGCYLEFSHIASSSGYHPGRDVLFTPGDPNLPRTTLPSATSVTRLPPDDYLVFGHWLYVPNDVESFEDYDFGVLAGGGDPYLSLADNLTGTAMYAGRAGGLYFTLTNPEREWGTFDADVTLTADFDNGTLGGRVENFRFNAAATGFPRQLHLLSSPIVPSPASIPPGQAVAAGVVADGLPTSSWDGEWNAAFYGNSANPTDHPGGIAGTFGATNDANDHGLAGAFGAYKQ